MPSNNSTAIRATHTDVLSEQGCSLQSLVAQVDGDPIMESFVSLNFVDLNIVLVRMLSTRKKKFTKTLDLK